MTDAEERAAPTPMSDYVARFWEILRTENVHIALNIRRDHENGPPHFDTAQFGEDVAKALVAERAKRASPAAERAAVPDGWQLVPTKLTKEIGAVMKECENGERSFKEAWTAMLAAAPTPPVQPALGEPVAWANPRGVADLKEHPNDAILVNGEKRHNFTALLYTRPQPAKEVVEALAKAREALEIIAGKRQCVDNLMSNVDVANAALASLSQEQE